MFGLAAIVLVFGGLVVAAAFPLAGWWLVALGVYCAYRAEGTPDPESLVMGLFLAIILLGSSWLGALQVIRALSGAP